MDCKTGIEALCVFNDLKNDRVIGALYDYLCKPTVGGYARFAALLYEANAGDLGAYLHDLVLKSENICLRLAGAGKEIPMHLRAALDRELRFLRELADLSPEKLKEYLPKDLPKDLALPGWISGGADLPDAFLSLLSNVRTRGYGMYAEHTMFRLDADGRIVPVAHPDRIALCDLVDYERERQAVLDNTDAFLAGKPAANVLLTGDAGTGKSSTVKAIVNARAGNGLRIVEIAKEQFRFLPDVIAALKENPLKFILFIDDLSFPGDDDSFNALKASLEGSVCAKSDNVVIYATSNRRHIVKERASDREGDDLHISETMQEQISLSDRFGLHISFYKPDKRTYLHIVAHLAEKRGIPVNEELFAGAERFALSRGGRSARLAKQYTDALQSGKEYK